MVKLLVHLKAIVVKRVAIELRVRNFEKKVL